MHPAFGRTPLDGPRTTGTCTNTTSCKAGTYLLVPVSLPFYTFPTNEKCYNYFDAGKYTYYVIWNKKLSTERKVTLTKNNLEACQSCEQSLPARTRL